MPGGDLAFPSSSGDTKKPQGQHQALALSLPTPSMEGLALTGRECEEERHKGFRE